MSIVEKVVLNCFGLMIRVDVFTPSLIYTYMAAIWLIPVHFGASFLTRACLTRSSWARPTSTRCQIGARQFGASFQFGACQFDARLFEAFCNGNRRTFYATRNDIVNEFIVDGLNASVCVTDLYIGEPGASCNTC